MKSAHFTQRCVDCSREFDQNRHVIKCVCGGLINFEYHSAATWPPAKKRGLVRYWPRIPIVEKSHVIQPSKSRYPTPLYKSKKLGSFLRLRNLWIKNETENFTKTFKARDALITLSRFQEIGLTEFVMCSTGNTAAAFSHAMASVNRPMTIHMYFPQSTVIDLHPHANGRTTVTTVNGDYIETMRTAHEYCIREGLTFEGGFANPSRIEGSKTIAYEIAESGLKPDWYVQAVTIGTGVYALRKGYRELQTIAGIDGMPRILAVQPEACGPMARAFRGRRDSIRKDDTLSTAGTFATTLSNAKPSFSYPYVRRAILDSDGTFEEVSEAEISQAFLLLIKLEGVLVDPAAATALAGVIKKVAKRDVDRDASILLNVSGGLRDEAPSRLGQG
jgi:threonine synthase